MVAAARREAAVQVAAREFVVLFRALRHRAVAEARAYGVLFARDDAGWLYSIVRDGDGDGIRKRDLLRGVDERVAGPWRVSLRWPSVELLVPIGEKPRGPPPSRSDLSNRDPVRFGRSDIVSFTPKGASIGFCQVLGESSG